MLLIHCIKINLQEKEYLCVWEKVTSYYGGIMGLCHDYKRLGSVVSHEGTCDKYINYRLTQMRRAIEKLNSLLWSPRIRMNVKFNLYRIILQPIATYASECWQLTKWTKDKFSTVEMVCLGISRQISRLHHVRNEVTMERANVKEIIAEIVKCGTDIVHTANEQQETVKHDTRISSAHRKKK